MDEILPSIAAAGLAVYVVTAMLALGLSSGPAGLVAALRDRGSMLRLVAAGGVAAPLGAWAVGTLVGLELPLLVGLVLLGAAAGPPTLGALGHRLGDGTGLPAGHAVTLTAVGVAAMVLLLTGPIAVDVRASNVLLPLAAGVVLPLVGGIVARSRDVASAERLLPWLERLVLVALAIGGGLAFLLASPAILRAVGSGGVLAIVLFGASVVGASVLLGVGRAGVGLAVAVLTLQRNLPVSAMLAITTFRSEPTVLAMVLGGVVALRVMQIPFAAMAGGGTSVAATASTARRTTADPEAAEALGASELPGTPVGLSPASALRNDRATEDALFP